MKRKVLISLFALLFSFILVGCNNQDYDMSNIKLEDKTVYYDGLSHSIEISGTLPEGVSVSYENNNQVEVGEYVVTAKFQGATNYNPISDMQATLKILPVEENVYDMTGVTFENKTIYYDGSSHRIEVSGTLPEGVSVSYENNDQVEIGEYTITANFQGASNYEPIPSMEATLTILEVELNIYDMTDVLFEDKTVYYDGSSYSIEISGTLPEGVSVTYENNNQVEVGEYVVIANFQGASNYEAIPRMEATLTVLPAFEKQLPSLENKSEASIRTTLQGLGFNNIIFEEVFHAQNFKGTFVRYQDYKTGDYAKVIDEIIVLIATKELPDLTKIYAEDIKNFFLEAGVSENNIIPIPQTFGDPEFGLGYMPPQAAGETYTSGPIKYYYNASEVKLRDLTGLSKYEIEEYLGKVDLTANFHYILDNSKEYEGFGGYIGYNIGSIIPINSHIDILLFENNDLDAENQLFISKYVGISDDDNGIELYNPTDEDIYLEDYYLSIFENGAISETYRIELTGIIRSKETFFIVSITSSQQLKDKAHQISSHLIFDGNDTIQLRKTYNNTYIDTIYNIGNTQLSLKDEIFIRRQTITRGNRGFQMKEWAGYIPTFIEPIGTHPYEVLAFPTFEFIEDIFQEYGMTKVKYLYAADGDTVYFESLDPRDTSSYTGDSRLRFLMINTPETQKQDQEGEPYAQVAKRFTEDALSNAVEIYIQADRQAGLKESYGRHLGVVWYNSGTIANPEWHLLNFELGYYGLGKVSGGKDGGGAYKNSSVWGNRYLYQWVLDADFHAKENELGIYSNEHMD